MVLGLSAFFQAAVAFLQFKTQTSVGLRFLGESILSGPLSRGAGRVAVSGAAILRVYGTMPHSNILAAFLALGLFGLYYLYLGTHSMRNRLLINVVIFFIMLALAFTFSRSGWIVFSLGTALILALGIFNPNYRRKALGLTFSVGMTVLLLFLIFGSVILPRAHFGVGETSVQDRVLYDYIGLEVLQNHPVDGVGLGNQVLYSLDNQLYQIFGFNRSAVWQPIHNLYLMIAVESGVLALTAFILFVLMIVWNRLIFIDLGFGVGAAILVAFLVFGLFDHFLWDLQSGELMLWLIFGIMIGLGPKLNAPVNHVAQS
jgi:O-antigen ligase